MLCHTARLTGRELRATDGTLGALKDFLLGDGRWTVRYALAETGPDLTDHAVLLAAEALGEPDAADGALPVWVSRGQVRTAPPVHDGRRLTRADEARLARHYGWTPYWGPYDSQTGVFRGADLPPVPVVPRKGGPVPRSAGAGPDLHRLSGVLGLSAEATDGCIGPVSGLIIDTEVWIVRYVVVDPTELPGGGQVLLATDWVDDLDRDEGILRVGVTLRQVRTSPAYDRSAPLDRDVEQALYDHYRRPCYWA